MAERFNRRIQDEVLCLTIHSHAALEQLLKGFCPAYNARRQRVLEGLSPNDVVRAHLEIRPRLANRRFKPPDPCAVTRDGEAKLSAWMDENAFVSWVEHPSPWLLEAEIIANVPLPLNLDQNAHHGFYRALTSLRQEAREQARALPIWNFSNAL